MNKIVFFLMFCLSVSYASGQNQSEPIEIRTKALGSVYLQDGRYLNVKQLTKIIKPYDPAYKELKKAKFTGFFSSLFSYVGGGLIGFPVGTALGGGDPEWGMAVAGIGVAGIGIALATVMDKQLKKSVIIYNSIQNQSFSTEQPKQGEMLQTPPAATTEKTVQDSSSGGNSTLTKLFADNNWFNESGAALVLGLNTGHFVTKAGTNVAISSEPRLGFQLGCMYNIHDFGIVGLRSGLIALVEKMDYASAPGIYLGYARIPLLGQRFVTEKLSFEGGINFDFWIFEMNDWEFNFEDASMNRWFNPVLTLGTEYKIFKNASIYASYNPSLGNMLSKDYRGSGSHVIKQKRNIFQIGINFDL